MPPLGTNFYNFIIPDDAVQLFVRIIPNDLSPPKFPQLPLYGKQTTLPQVTPNSPDFRGTNQFTVNVTPGMVL